MPTDANQPKDGVVGDNEVATPKGIKLKYDLATSVWLQIPLLQRPVPPHRARPVPA